MSGNACTHGKVNAGSKAHVHTHTDAIDASDKANVNVHMHACNDAHTHSRVQAHGKANTCSKVHMQVMQAVMHMHAARQVQTAKHTYMARQMHMVMHTHTQQSTYNSALLQSLQAAAVCLREVACFRSAMKPARFLDAAYHLCNRELSRYSAHWSSKGVLLTGCNPSGAGTVAVYS